MSEFKDASVVEINEIMDAAKSAALAIKKASLGKRTELMNAIAD